MAKPEMMRPWFCSGCKRIRDLCVMVEKLL